MELTAVQDLMERLYGEHDREQLEPARSNRQQQFVTRAQENDGHYGTSRVALRGTMSVRGTG